MRPTNSERFIKTHEKIKSRAIASIFRKQKALFIEYLNREEKSFSWEKKVTPDEFLDPFLDEIAPDVPNYLLSVLPRIMEEGAKEPIRRYRDLLPEDYSLSFDVETSPASQYLQDLDDLMLSEAEGSILKTTRDELRTIMRDGIDEGLSYGEIGKKIEEVDPWVFSKSRAELIAVNEIGRAYGWANFQPAIDLRKEGYVMEKLWQTSEDEKVRKTHRINGEAGWIPLEASFPGTYDQFAPSTRDVRCRCTSTHRIAGIKDISGNIHFLTKGMTSIEVKEKYFEVRKKSL